MTAELLKQIFHVPKDPGSYGGVDRLLKRAKELNVSNANRKTVKEYLSGKQAYTLYKPALKHYLRNHIYISGIDAQWQADLADIKGIARQN